MSIKGTIIWDFDGTIADRPFTWSGSILAAFDEIQPGHSVKIEQVKVHTGKNFPWHEPEKDYLHLRDPEVWWAKMEEMLLNIVTSFRPSGDLAKAIVKAARRNIVDPARYKIFPDVIPALTSLRESGWKHVILSNNYPDLEAVVAGMGIGGYFEGIYTSALIGYEKPRREIYEFVREKIKNRERLWMIGDSEGADALGPEAVGISGILVRHRDSKFHRQAKDLSEAVAHIER